MSLRILRRTQNLIWKLDGEGLPKCDIARRVNVSYMTVHNYIELRRLGLSSTSELLEKWAKRAGHKSYRDYKEYLISANGYISLTDYRKKLQEKCKKRIRNRKFSRLLKIGLVEKERNQYWLAKETGLSRQTISLYVKGEMLPSDNSLRKICKALLIPYKTLDGLILNV